MSIQIPKGGNQSLEEAGIRGPQCFIGLGWSAPPSSKTCEIDASAFVLSENGLIISDGSFIFYNQRCDDASGFLILLENDLPSIEGEEELADKLDRQSFLLDLSKVPPSVSRIAFCLTIHEAESRGQSFALVEQVHLRLVDPDSGIEALRFPAADGFQTETAVVMAEIYRRNDQWKLKAVGQGYAGGLAALAGGFGVKLHEPVPTGSSAAPEALLDPAPTA